MINDMINAMIRAFLVFALVLPFTAMGQMDSRRKMSREEYEKRKREQVGRRKTARPPRRVKRKRPPAVSPAPVAAPEAPPAPQSLHSGEGGERRPRRRPGAAVYSADLMTWQESIQLDNGTTTAKMESQFKAMVLGFDRHVSRGPSDWQWLFGFGLGLGSMKGKGDERIPDQFNSQPFLMGIARAGMVYRSSPAAKLGILIPLTYRQIDWVYDPGSPTRGKDEKFSAGLSALYVVRLGKRLDFQATVTHQHMWETVQWAAGLALEL